MFKTKRFVKQRTDYVYPALEFHLLNAVGYKWYKLPYLYNILIEKKIGPSNHEFDTYENMKSNHLIIYIMKLVKLFLFVMIYLLLLV